MAWTDERLDDLARRMDAGFERIDGDLRELRAGVTAQSTELHGAVTTQAAELQRAIATQGTELRGEIAELRITLLRVGGGILAGLVGVIAAVLIGG